MANTNKPILLNAFNMNCVGHINHGLWTHPRDRSTDYRLLPYWTNLARTLERGLFDGLFLADIVGVYDVYQHNVDVTLRESIQLPVNDPTLLVSAMAAVTEHLGFGVTVNLTYEQPYLLARRFSTLDHLTQGRIGWNIVTGYLDSAARAMGLTEQLPHDERYDRADEYLDVLYKLWEGSWEPDAVRRDKAARVFADPAKVHRVQHAGRYYNVDGYHLAEPSPQRTPVLFQAGSSGRGQRFAARHAECVFISPPNRQVGRETVRTLREELVRAGRRPDDVKVFVGAAVVPGATEAQAREKYADYLHYASREAGLAHFAASTGIDYAQYDLDAPVDYAPGNAIESATRTAKQHGWTRRRLLEMFELGGRYPAIVGTAAHVADELQAWVDEAGVDGFNLSRTVVPESYEDFVDLVVPELQNRGLYKTAYAPGSLRQKLFGEGDTLPLRHAGASFRQRAEAIA
ncbi:LLM class flavin-dependent oxidoreductase [Paraburkholderia caballeronis]|uniref:FMN-dependent oxidoreductase, nitrilotriacetate monooxygenase family n=1 Tax=Paraburkholderia caballeronis TaxID=416943 RepID=A0A1H7JP83_9BURK|nr:LLM class flavin-dependent oxidoreductase [Paraburkholderia caballeronis]PXW27376.1 FMN-dependent oxidoreductase (nitrilotriacetate monooxygenase family) [Paraburkholderia caballeronis]PXX02850.1 FMN-dependent oxidoreductase (nitrilotriacetate monooxygenase family) [Paraburkholderia caballeronis]RAK03575.1 FMN-dependent oxidoreductase (nitrilotriacetate monooxygenase family) [Paraburkholderia caballeronis]SEC32642.1 FMN-dependent oxidoreductase, nitrilotriacetate monooxygenase family [Parabu